MSFSRTPIQLACILFVGTLLAAANFGKPGIRGESQDPTESVAEPQVFAGGVYMDVAKGLVAFPVVVEVTDALLEYLVVGAHGAAHESMFVTGADAEIVNAGLLAAGLVPGSNARWVPKDPAPSREERRAGVSPYDVELPSGDAVYLYVGWREDGEVYWYRAEDLVRDTSRGRTMRRHSWIFLGSRLVTLATRPAEELFAATVEGNWINLPFFAAGSTLVTSALPESVEQSVWLPNAWLLPHRGSGLLMVASTSRLAAPPQGLLERLPLVVAGEVTKVEPAFEKQRHVPQKQQAGNSDDKAGGDVR